METTLLDELMGNLDAATEALKDMKPGLPDAQVTDAIRLAHCAGRSALSEFKALQIDRIPLDATYLNRLHAAHDTATKILNTTPANDPLVQGFATMITKRLEEITHMRSALQSAA